MHAAEVCYHLQQVHPSTVQSSDSPTPTSVSHQSGHAQLKPEYHIRLHLGQEGCSQPLPTFPQQAPSVGSWLAVASQAQHDKHQHNKPACHVGSDGCGLPTGCIHAHTLSISTMTTFSTVLWRSTSRAVAPSPPACAGRGRQWHTYQG